jgi:hypothetical protein
MGCFTFIFDSTTTLQLNWLRLLEAVIPFYDVLFEHLPTYQLNKTIQFYIEITISQLLIGQLINRNSQLSQKRS